MLLSAVSCPFVTWLTFSGAEVSPWNRKAFHRKLAAILSADVAGCSRLMQDDEAATVKILEAYKTAVCL